MPKHSQSYRLEEEQMEQLNKLVEYYKVAMGQGINNSFQVKVSKASVLELLIRERFNELNAEGKL